MSVKDFVKSASRKIASRDQGTHDYQVPVRDNYYKTSYILKWPKRKEDNTFINQVIKRSKLIPECSKYSKIINWGQMSSNGKFNKDKKNTYIDTIMKQPKQPGPGAYNNFPKFRILGSTKQ